MALKPSGVVVIGAWMSQHAAKLETIRNIARTTHWLSARVSRSCEPFCKIFRCGGIRTLTHWHIHETVWGFGKWISGYTAELSSIQVQRLRHLQTNSRKKSGLLRARSRTMIWSSRRSAPLDFHNYIPHMRPFRCQVVARFVTTRQYNNLATTQQAPNTPLRTILVWFRIRCSANLLCTVASQLRNMMRTWCHDMRKDYYNPCMREKRASRVVWNLRSREHWFLWMLFHVLLVQDITTKKLTGCDNAQECKKKMFSSFTQTVSWFKKTVRVEPVIINDKEEG